MGSPTVGKRQKIIKDQVIKIKNRRMTKNATMQESDQDDNIIYKAYQEMKDQKKKAQELKKEEEKKNQDLKTVTQKEVSEEKTK
jgi:hypothetical protein